MTVAYDEGTVAYSYADPFGYRYSSENGGGFYTRDNKFIPTKNFITYSQNASNTIAAMLGKSADQLTTQEKLAYVEPIVAGAKTVEQVQNEYKLSQVKNQLQQQPPTTTTNTDTATTNTGNSTVSNIVQALKEAGVITDTTTKTPTQTRDEITAEYTPKLAEAYKPYEERSIELIKKATEPTLQKSVESTQKELGARGLSGGVTSKTLREKVYEPYQEKLAVSAENIALESWKAQRTELENIINTQTTYDAQTRSILLNAASTATAMDFQEQMQESQNIYDWTKFQLSMDYDIWKTEYTAELQTKLTNAQIDSQSELDINNIVSSIFAGLGTYIGKKI